ncbi:hypothetical protein MMC09_004548 [Bachmanniomyces sp. S44760]|nr:hypothetical protein [Bachmanniomyces sp. S44760]
MDPVQQKALNALEPYILLSKSATSPRAAADLISQATSAANTYFFAELLQTPNIQSLRTAPEEYSSYLTVLEIFSYGTWTDYHSTPNLPALSDAQTLKLRQLTLLSLSTSHDTLTYPSLLQSLSLSTQRSLEDLIISSIYSGLLVAKLDPLAQRCDVSSVSPLRDPKPGSVPKVIAILDDWNTRCEGVLGDIEAQVAEVKSAARERRRVEIGRAKAIERAMIREGGESTAGDKDGGILNSAGVYLGGKRMAGKRGPAGDAENGMLQGGGMFDGMDLDAGMGGRGEARNAKRGGRFSFTKR